MTTLYRFDPKDVVDAMRKHLGGAIEPSSWSCPCGCDNVVVYARDDRALWIAVTVTSSLEAPLRLIGLQNQDELGDFLLAFRDEAVKRRVPEGDFDQLECLLTNAAGFGRPRLDADFERPGERGPE